MCERQCQRSNACGKVVKFPQGQSRKMSLAEAATSTVIGFIISVAAQYAIFPLFDIYVPFHEHALMGLFFTVVSVIRGYLIRRLFNRLHIGGR